MKPGTKRKRTKKEMEKFRQDEEEMKMERESIISSKRKFELESQQKETEILELTKYKNLVHSLHSKGVIDDSG